MMVLVMLTLNEHEHGPLGDKQDYYYYVHVLKHLTYLNTRC